MATSRQDSDCAPQHKRARIVVEPSSAPLSSSSCAVGPLSRWQWSPTSDTYQQYVAARQSTSPEMNGSSTDTASRSGSEQGGDPGGGRGQKSSPVSTPVVVSVFGNSTIPKSMTVVSPSSNGLVTTASALVQIPPDSRPCLIRPTPLAHEQTANAPSSVGVVAPWQDFGDGLNFDASLSGLSDLTGSGYVNEMIEFVKRQSNNSSGMIGANGESYFQYVLMAPTSAGVRLNEEALTYLNQGQSYEIRCRRLGVEGVTPGRLFKSILRVTFHDRRQKFQERELMDQWKNMHAGETLMDVDIPMSYNIFNVRTDPTGATLEFLWDPTKNAGVFIKVNCISTDFTARKHGGEKGVPFRLQVDTYVCGDDIEQKHLHSSYAQVKVFKTKGADRKNKTDREKAEKRADKEKYQPAYDYTILTETFQSDFYDCDQQQRQPRTDVIAEDSVGRRESSPLTRKRSVSPPVPNGCPKQLGPQNTNMNSKRMSLSSVDSGVTSHVGATSPLSFGTEDRDRTEALPIDASPDETMQWLCRHRFGAYVKVFNSFSGADYLRLSREDLVQICGTADGIRLFNALQHRKLQPKLTLYMCAPGAPAFHAVFLISLTLRELSNKVCELVQIQPNQLFDVYCQGPDGINVHMNDEVVQNLPDRSKYVIDTMKCGDEQSERYRILLKTSSE